MAWIFVDLDNTLYDYDSCNVPAMAAVTQELNKLGDGQKLYEEGKKRTKLMLQGTAAEHSRLHYVLHAIESTGKANPKLALQLHTLFWDEYFKHMRLHDGVLDFIAEGKSRGFQFCLITNHTTELQYRKLIHLGLDTAFDCIVTSEEAGLEKPNPRIFFYACAKAGCAPRGAVLIDDELSAVEAATCMGMAAILVEHETDWARMKQRVFR